MKNSDLLEIFNISAVVSNDPFEPNDFLNLQFAVAFCTLHFAHQVH